MKTKWSRRIGVTLLCVLFLLPMAVMFLGALHEPGEVPPEGFDLIPDFAHWENFGTIATLMDLWAQMRNSLIVVAVAVPVTVVIASWAGFAIVTGSRRVRVWLIGISIVALMIPATALWIPRFILFERVGLIDSLWVLMVPALMATSPFYVLIFALAYSRIPAQLFEAARVEGLSPLRTWAIIAWPLARPAAFAVAMLAFIFHWSNFVDALLYLRSEATYTLPLGLRALQTFEVTLHPLMLAGAALATIPSLVAFLIGQRALFARTLEMP